MREIRRWICVCKNRKLPPTTTPFDRRPIWSIRNTYDQSTTDRRSSPTSSRSSKASWLVESRVRSIAAKCRHPWPKTILRTYRNVRDRLGQNLGEAKSQGRLSLAANCQSKPSTIHSSSGDHNGRKWPEDIPRRRGIPSTKRARSKFSSSYHPAKSKSNEC